MCIHIEKWWNEKSLISWNNLSSTRWKKNDGYFMCPHEDNNRTQKMYKTHAQKDLPRSQIQSHRKEHIATEFAHFSHLSISPHVSPSAIFNKTINARFFIHQMALLFTSRYFHVFSPPFALSPFSCFSFHLLSSLIHLYIKLQYFFFSSETRISFVSFQEIYLKTFACLLNKWKSDLL